MKILLVEDDAALVRALRRGLSAHGHELISAENGEDGAAMAGEAAVDFVLLDLDERAVARWQKESGSQCRRSTSIS